MLALRLALATLPAMPGYAAESEQDLQTCIQQLRRIGEAVAAYRQEHGGQYPATLSALARQYLSDPAVLRCPAAIKSGVAGPANRNLIDPSVDEVLVVGYNWEMSPEDPPLWEGSGYGFSFRRFKEYQQQSLVGQHLPVVRCTHHPKAGATRVLNLTSDGRVYESDVYWEANFVAILPGARLSPEMVRLANLPMSQLVRARAVRATPAMLDLRAHYNTRFEDPWIRSRRGDEWFHFTRGLTEGLLSDQGIDFEPAGIIQLNGRVTSDANSGYTRLKYPTNQVIPLNQSFRVLHVLGGVVFESAEESVVARLEFFHADGRLAASWEWKYGREVAQIVSTVRADAGLRPAWAGQFSEGDLAGRWARLFHIRFENPHPEAVIGELKFSMGDTVSAPLIAAITLEK